MTLHNALGVVSRIQNRNKVFPEGNRGDTRAP
jgi:hypothetical protein